MFNVLLVYVQERAKYNPPTWKVSMGIHHLPPQMAPQFQGDLDAVMPGS